MEHLDGNLITFAVQSSCPNRSTLRGIPVYSVLDFNENFNFIIQCFKLILILISLMAEKKIYQIKAG